MKMRILLGSALLTIACGFPTGAPLATTVEPETKPSVEQLIDEYVNRAKAAAAGAPEETTTAEPTTTEEPKLRKDIDEIFNVFAAANIPHEAINDFIDQGLHFAYDDEQSANLRRREWVQKWNIEQQLGEGAKRIRDDEQAIAERKKDQDRLSEIVDLFHAANVPQEAIDDFVSRGIHLARDEATSMQRFMEWANKWNVVQVYEDAVNARHATATPEPEKTTTWTTTTEAEKETTTWSPFGDFSEFTVEKYNSWVLANMDNIRELYRQKGASEQQIDEYFATGAHLLPMTAESFLAVKAWARKWGVDLGNDSFVDKDSDATTTPAYETTTVKDAAEELIRERFTKMGFPEEAIDEYFALGLASDSQDEEWQSLFTTWCNKWKHTLPHYNEAKAMQQEIMNEVSQIFEKTYMAVSIMQALSYSDEQPNEEQMEDIMKTYFNNLSEYEKELVGRVMQHVGEKVGKKFMEKIEAENKEKKWISY